MLHMYPLKVTKQVYKLRALLDDMAHLRNADEIAAFLKVRDVSGAPILPHSCPLAKYVANTMNLKPRRVSGRVISFVEVSGTSIRCTFGYVTVEIEHAPQIRDFIYRFDRGYYPELFPARGPLRKAARYCLALGIAGPELQRVPDDRRSRAGR
jgi:hypothetical protein